MVHIAERLTRYRIKIFFEEKVNRFLRNPSLKKEITTHIKSVTYKQTV